MKKDIKIKFVDFWNGFNYEDFYIYKLLTSKYNVIISDYPDYIFYSVSGYNHLKYDCIRIFYTGENIRPNFNHCDYAMAFDYISFEDRYLRLPIYLALYRYLEIFEIALDKHYNEDNFKIREKFCNMVVSNSLGDERLSFFKKLSDYKQVDSGGKTFNNVGGPVESKLEFQKKYKFSMAFENSSSNGYTTEKLVDAFASGGIPIYWGDPLVTNIFNPKAFINANNFINEIELIEFIKKMDTNDTLYLEFIKQPVLNDNDYLKKEQEKIENFIYKIFDEESSKAKRRSESLQVIQEKRSLMLVERILNLARPLLKIKSKIKNKLVK